MLDIRYLFKLIPTRMCTQAMIRLGRGNCSVLNLLFRYQSHRRLWWTCHRTTPRAPVMRVLKYLHRRHHCPRDYLSAVGWRRLEDINPVVLSFTARHEKSLCLVCLVWPDYRKYSILTPKHTFSVAYFLDTYPSTRVRIARVRQSWYGKVGVDFF